MAFRIFKRLQDLLDVNATGLADNDVPTWDAATSKFTMEAAGGGGAPTTATYLVGAADATLTNEIVVGATPGGELGNTWASPTVDAVHSGSSHAQTQTAAEATAAAALAAHVLVDVVDGDAAGGVLSGTYPNPGFAADMATQAELDAIAAGAVILAPASSARNVIQPTAGAVIAAIVKAHASQSVDIWNVQKSDGAKYVRVGASGAVGIGAGAYDPAFYGGWLSALVLSRASDAWYDALGGPSFTPGATESVDAFFLDVSVEPTADGLVNGTDHYGIGASIRLGGDKTALKMQGSYNEAVMRGTKVSGSAQLTELLGGAFSGYSDFASTGDVTNMSGVFGTVLHTGTGLVTLARGVRAKATAENNARIIEIVGLEAEVGVDGASATALTALTGLRVVSSILGTRTVTTSKGLHVPNMGDAQVATSYGIFVDSQSGATNVYGLWVAGGKSVFVDTLLTGKIAAPADVDIANSQGGWWWDEANSLPKWKGKTSAGTVVNATPYTVGGTDVAVADGGTGASTAAAARTNLDVPSNAEAILDTLVDAKGDMLIGTAADTVARLAVGANGTRPVAASGEATGLAWSLPPGYEVAFAEATADVVVTSTTEATQDLILSLGAVTYTAVRHKFTFYAPAITVTSAAAQVICFWNDTTLITRVWQNNNDLSSLYGGPCFTFFYTPTAASHTFKIMGFRSGGTSFTLEAAAWGGGAGTFAPIQFRAEIA